MRKARKPTKSARTRTASRGKPASTPAMAALSPETLDRIAAALERLSPVPNASPDFRAADAFVWHAAGSVLLPVKRVNRVDLGLLKGIDRMRDTLIENTERFAKETGVEVKVDFAGWEDLRPQTAVSANTGAGADVIVGWADDPHIYADSLVPLDDIADYLGKKYGGWYPLVEKYGRDVRNGTWISMPVLSLP